MEHYFGFPLEVLRSQNIVRRGDSHYEDVASISRDRKVMLALCKMRVQAWIDRSMLFVKRRDPGKAANSLPDLPHLDVVVCDAALIKGLYGMIDIQTALPFISDLRLSDAFP